jgi:hypothetical protein
VLEIEGGAKDVRSSHGGGAGCGLDGCAEFALAKGGNQKFARMVALA